MTNSEFDEWFAAHCASFTAVAAWFENLPKKGIDQAETAKGWFFVLQDIELTDAVEATRIMFREHEDVFFDRHPALIRRLASKLSAPRRMAEKARVWTKSEPRFRCHECLDSGYRRVLHPKTVRDYRDGAGGFLYTCAVACPCSIGLDKFPDEKYPRYDPTRCCLIEIRTEDGITMATQEQMREMLTAWLEVRKQESVERSYADNWNPPRGSSYELSAGAKAVAMFGEDGNGHEGF